MQMTPVYVDQLPTNLTFVSDSHDVAAIVESVGNGGEGYGAFFVNAVDGEYTEVWGMFGSVPYNDARVYRVL